MPSKYSIKTKSEIARQTVHTQKGNYEVQHDLILIYQHVNAYIYNIAKMYSDLCLNFFSWNIFIKPLFF